MGGRKTLEERLGIHSRDDFLRYIKEKYKEDENFRLSYGTPLYRLGYKKRDEWMLKDERGMFSISYIERLIGEEPRNMNNQREVWTKETILYCIRFFEDMGIPFTSSNKTQVDVLLPNGDSLRVSPMRVYNKAQGKTYFRDENGKFVGVDGLKRMAYNDGINMDLKSEVIRYLVEANGGRLMINGVLLNSSLPWSRLEEIAGKDREQLIAEALLDKRR